MRKNIITLLALLSFWLVATPAMAEMVAKAAPAAEEENCSMGSASDQFGCMRARISVREDEMSRLIKESIDTYKNHWGAEAVVENQNRIRESQDAWIRYKDAHCSVGYYGMAPSHPPSQSMYITQCLLRLTEARIEEIKENYIAPYPRSW